MVFSIDAIGINQPIGPFPEVNDSGGIFVFHAPPVRVKAGTPEFSRNPYEVKALGVWETIQ